MCGGRGGIRELNRVNDRPERGERYWIGGEWKRDESRSGGEV